MSTKKKASFFDIVSVSKEVVFTDAADNEIVIPVYGVGMAKIAGLLLRFPVLQQMFSGEEIEMSALTVAGEGAITAALCAATRQKETEEIAEALGRIPLDIQFDIIAASIELTMPEGFGPFVEKIRALGEKMNLTMISESVQNSMPPLTGGAGLNGQRQAPPMAAE